MVIPRIGDKPIDFKTVIASDIPPVLKGDTGKLKQIILNFEVIPNFIDTIKFGIPLIRIWANILKH